jgi:hypothetical protein
MSAHVVRQETACLKVLERAFNQAPESLQYLKKYSMANLYRYLSFKVLDAYPDRKRGLIAARFLWQLIKNDLASLRQYSTWQVLFRVAVWVLLPPHKAQRLIDSVPPLPYIHADLLMHFKTDIFLT